MSKRLIGGLLLAGALLAGGIAMYPGVNESDQKSKLEYAAIENETARGGAQFYDVRTPEEFAAGRFATAQNFPLQDMQAGKFPDVAKDAQIYIHCRSGNRSAEAAQLLKRAGYTNVTDLGGLEDVKALGGQLST